MLLLPLPSSSYSEDTGSSAVCASAAVLPSFSIDAIGIIFNEANGKELRLRTLSKSRLSQPRSVSISLGAWAGFLIDSPLIGR